METTVEYKEILDHVQTGILATDHAGVIAYANQSAFVLLGLNESDILPSGHITEIMPALGKSVMECLETGKMRSDLHVSHADTSLLVSISLIGRARYPAVRFAASGRWELILAASSKPV